MQLYLVKSGASPILNSYSDPYNWFNKCPGGRNCLYVTKCDIWYNCWEKEVFQDIILIYLGFISWYKNINSFTFYFFLVIYLYWERKER